MYERFMEAGPSLNLITDLSVNQRRVLNEEQFEDINIHKMQMHVQKKSINYLSLVLVMKSSLGTWAHTIAKYQSWRATLQKHLLLTC